MKKILYSFIFLTSLQSFCNIHVVTNTLDSGPGSLRQAIIDANADATPPRTITFSIGVGVQTIQPLTALPALTADQIIIDGSSQPGWSAGNPVIVLDGTSSAFSFDGLTINGADNCVIQDLVINNGFLNGINISNSTTNNNAIYGCFCGTNQAGTAASPNAIGLMVNASGANQHSNTIIGSATHGNLFSGNAGPLGAGIFLSGNLNSTIVQGNKIGTDKTGTVAVANTAGGLAIISQPSSSSVSCDATLIGGSGSGQGNVISGNGPGISLAPGIFMGFQPISNTIIRGNKIGVDITGTLPLPNDLGIVTFTDIATTIENTIIGGATDNEKNVVSANRFDGVALQVSVNNTIVRGNYIGTDITGTVALGNGGNGLVLEGNNNIVGGAGAGEFNVISNNAGNGISITGNNSIIRGNYIGTDINVSVGMGNTNNGIEIQGDLPIIGGTGTNQGNIIGANGLNGIQFNGSTTNAIIQGNSIGSDPTGSVKLSNGSSGILLQGSLNNPCSNNLIGGLTQAAKNLIKFNSNVGVFIDGDATTPDILNPILGNSIYLNTNRGILLVNGGNNMQEPPVINSAELCPFNQVIVISATAPSNPPGSFFRLEFFVNTINKNPVTEGERFIGAIDNVPSGATVSQSFAISPPAVSVGQWVSATATNLNNVGGLPGDTSEFTLNTVITGATPPVVTLDASPSTICAGSPSTLTATITGTGPFNLVWSDGFTQMGVSSPVSRVVTPTTTTLYSVTVTDAVGCESASASALVTVNPTPSLILSASPIAVLPGQNTTITASPSGNGPFTLAWSDGVTQIGVTGPVSRTFTLTHTTTFTVTVTDSNGCQFTATITVLVLGKLSPISKAILAKYCSLIV